MPVLTGSYNLDLTALPANAEKQRVRFDTQVVNGKNRLLMMYPASGQGFEPTYVRYMVGMTLRLGDGTTAQQQGQLIVTGQRLLGMFTSGSVGNKQLNGQAGSIFVFTIDLDDIDVITPKTNRRGKPVEATLSSRDDLDPWFVLHIITVAASLKNDGTAKPTSIQAFLPRLSPEGRRELQGS
jgi:hypothetical protein